MITKYDTKFSGETVKITVKIETVYTNYFTIIQWDTTIRIISIFGKNEKSTITFLRKQFDLEYDDAEILYNACVRFINSATKRE